MEFNKKCNLVTELEEPIQLTVSISYWNNLFFIGYYLEAIRFLMYLYEIEAKNWSMWNVDRFSENYHSTLVYDT